jgi:hypothetical protein
MSIPPNACRICSTLNAIVAHGLKRGFSETHTHIRTHESGLSEVNLFLKSFVLVLLLSITAQVGVAQQIPSSPQGAEAEGVTFPHGASPPRIAPSFAARFRGTAERRCVTPYSNVGVDSSSHSDGPLRSGEFIVRYGGLFVNQPTKMLWMPLHNPSDYSGTLLIRAVRPDHPDDSLRVSVSDWGWSGSHVNSGYVSSVAFPSPGTWLVIATAGPDWGCYLLSVAG